MSNVTSIVKSADARKRKAALTRKLQELSSLGGQREDIQIEYAADPLDQVRSGLDREIVIRQLDRQARSIHEVQTALARIEDGSYGLCEQCEEEISAKRLDAIPWARLCVACQSIAEAGPGERAEDRSSGREVLFHAAA
jgi:DnaK suppressor protein